jgi:uncharacterized protein (DUF2132 family)
VVDEGTTGATPDPQPPARPKNPLHGITLERIVTRLAEHHGWEELSLLIPINCFRFDPSVKSSLTFLRKTPWARKRVEQLYLATKFRDESGA